MTGVGARTDDCVAIVKLDLARQRRAVLQGWHAAASTGIDSITLGDVADGSSSSESNIRTVVVLCRRSESVRPVRAMGVFKTRARKHKDCQQETMDSTVLLSSLRAYEVPMPEQDRICLRVFGRHIDTKHISGTWLSLAFLIRRRGLTDRFSFADLVISSPAGTSRVLRKSILFSSANPGTRGQCGQRDATPSLFNLESIRKYSPYRRWDGDGIACAPLRSGLCKSLF